MNRQVFIRQIGAATCFGNSVERLIEALMSGRSGIQPTARFDCQNYASALCATIPDLDSTPPGQASIQLLDALLSSIAPLPTSAFTLLATTKGAIDLLQHQNRSGNGSDASTGEIHHTLSWLQKRLGTKRMGLNISAACASSTIAIAKASAMIRSGMVDDCIVIAYDLLSEFTQSGFSGIKSASPERCRPFDIRRKGLNLGESAACIHLSSRSEVVGTIPQVTIRGCGISSDAAHITAPARDGSGLIRACRIAMDAAQICPESIAGISAHGTGTVYNDAMEMTAFNTLFHENPPPFFSIKGATGHTLGAAGALETVVSVLAMAAGSIPPTIGCENPAEEGKGRVKATPQELEGSFMLKTNSGFGGINAALLLEQIL